MMVLRMVRMESGVMAVGEGVWFGREGVGGREGESIVSKKSRSCRETTPLQPTDSLHRRS